MSKFIDRRDLIGMGTAGLALATLTGKKASAQTCQPPQHFTSEFRLFVLNDCLNEYTLLNAVIKTNRSNMFEHGRFRFVQNSVPNPRHRTGL